MLRKRYLVRFIKTIADDYGREHETPQGWIEVFAASEAEALEQAKAEFCRQGRMQDWSTRADRYEICEPEYAS